MSGVKMPRIASVSLLCLLLAAPLRAQRPEERGRHASFVAGMSLGDGNAALALTAALGFRLSSRIGLDIELAHARKLDFTLDFCPPPRTCLIGGRFAVTGRTVSLVPHLTIELVPDSRRVRAYAQAGAGAGHVRQRYFLGPPFIGSAGERVEFTRSSPVLALSFGAGVTTQISKRFAIGADVRSLHLLDQPADPARFITPSGTLSTIRVGSRVSWRF